MEKKTFEVIGMKCMHCKANVENAALTLDGVASADASLEDKNLTVEFDSAKVSPEQIKDAVEDSGKFELVL